MPVCPRDLRTIGDEPVLVSLDDCGEFVVHDARILLRPRPNGFKVTPIGSKPFDEQM